MADDYSYTYCEVREKTGQIHVVYLVNQFKT